MFFQLYNAMIFIENINYIKKTCTKATSPSTLTWMNEAAPLRGFGLEVLKAIVDVFGPAKADNLHSHASLSSGTSPQLTLRLMVPTCH
jgi:hypothetical protein